MLSFKDGKAMKPLYDYYVETDLDTIDDQPIDYSKRYDDQLADDVCGSSSRKKRHLSTPSENVVPNKIPGDELKVYCIEGTPLLISSASSLCDLHEIGALLQASESGPLKDDSEQKNCFQEPNPRESASPRAKCDELLGDSNCEQVQSESKEGTTQENTSSRTEETFSKASSPLMFSRSSSICSLNSFEQHSIVDDRSSVSMFSNLASGIISPSEIPDSPGEAMSPFIHKRQSEFIFPPTDPQPKSMDPVLAKLKMTPPFPDEVFEDTPEDNLKVYNDEGDCCSVSNLSALSIQTSSLNRVSVAVFHKSSFPVVEHKSSIRISCSIVTGNAELQSIEEDDVKESVFNNGVKSFGSYGEEDCMMEDDEDQDEKINFSRLVEEEEDCKDGVGSPVGDFSFEEGFEVHSGSFEKPVEDGDFVPESESPDYYKDNSDDEDCNALLEECIKSGMPTSNNESHQQLSKQQPNDVCVSNQELKPKEEIQEQNVSHSDCDTSDSEGEDLLQSCIQLGMPQKSPNKEPVTSNDSNNSLNSSETPHNFSKAEDITEVSDDEDYDPVLQHVIQLGKPRNEPKESCRNNANVSNSYASGFLDLGYRDNRPDGTSDDEDDDDDILTKCIQAGMPKPKIDESKSLYTLPVKSPCVKSQSHSHRPSPASNDRAAYMSSFTGPHQPFRKSPTAEYKTVNLKPNQQRKSPTKDRVTPLNSYNRTHQRQPHKRSPSAGDRALLLSSLVGQQHCSGGPTTQMSSLGVQQLQSRKKSPARMLLPPNGQQRRSPVVSERMLFSNPGNQPAMFSNPANQPMVSSNQGNQPTTFSNPGNNLTMFSATGNHTKTFSNSRNQPAFTNPGNQPKMFPNPGNQSKRISSPSSDSFQKKYQCWIQDFRDPKIEPAPIPDATCTYRTEDTPILSPSASVSDLSTLSFSEDRLYLDCSLNNSRNSDCSSESEEDELLRQCIRSGMPSEKRALA